MPPAQTTSTPHASGWRTTVSASRKLPGPSGMGAVAGRMAQVSTTGLRVSSMLCRNQAVALQGLLQAWHCVKQYLHAQLSGGVGRQVRRVGRGTSNGPASAQHHPLLPFFFIHHLHNPKNWSKIQLLDEKTDSPNASRSPPCPTAPNSPPVSRKFWTDRKSVV